jgi:hypothetical protein
MFLALGVTNHYLGGPTTGTSISSLDKTLPLPMNLLFDIGLPLTLTLRSTNAIVIWRRSPGRHECVRAAAVGEPLTEGARRDRP